MKLNDSNKYPLASFCLVAYQEEKYIADAVNAAFCQDYPNLEIIMSDDGSSDRTFQIMREMAEAYRGPHKIILNQNKTTLGPRENYNKVMYELSHGEFVLFADGDDISAPNRTSICVNFLMSNPNVASLSCVSEIIAEDGTRQTPNVWDILCRGHVSIYTLADYINFPFYILSGDSRVLRRLVIDSFPSLEYSYSEDIILFVRSFYVGDVALLHMPLVKYRQRADSIMGKHRSKHFTKNDIEIFNNTTVRQLEADFRYAVENNYFCMGSEPHIHYKLQKVEEWLRPKRKTIIWRFINRLHSLSEVMYEKVLGKLE